MMSTPSGSAPIRSLAMESISKWMDRCIWVDGFGNRAMYLDDNLWGMGAGGSCKINRSGSVVLEIG